MNSFSVSQVLWSGGMKKKLTSVFVDLYGKKAGGELAREVSQQALLTYLKSLVRLLERLSEGHSSSRIREILQSVEAIYGLEDPKVPELKIKDSLSEALVLCVQHATLSQLLFARKSVLPSVYKDVVAFYRELFSFPPQDFRRTCTQRNSAIRQTKLVARYLSNDMEEHAEDEQVRFLERHSVSSISKVLLTHAKNLERQMPSLWIKDAYARQKKSKPKDTPSHQGKVTGKRTRKQRDIEVPFFFSDDDDGEMASLATNENFNRRTAHHEEASETPGVARKKSRTDESYVTRSAQKEASKRVENDDVDEEDQSALMDAVDDMDSQQFPETLPSEEVHHVARYAERRGKGRRNPSRKARPIPSANQEEAEEENDAPGDSDSNFSDDLQDMTTGEGAEVLMGLRNATSRLASNVKDPLEETRKAMAKAKAKRFQEHIVEPAYEPGQGRVETHFGDSDDENEDENELHTRAPTRKRKTNMELSPMRGRKPRRVDRLNGKILRKGRFEPYEDELLIAGLEQHGFGAWKDISDDFGDDEYARAPESLKDRARTLELGPKDFPIKPARGRGRPRGSKMSAEKRRKESIKTRNRGDNADAEDDNQDAGNDSIESDGEDES